MNTLLLERPLQKGEHVIVNKIFMTTKYKALSERIFVCESGPGMSPSAEGLAIYGYWLSDSTENRTYLNASKINREETLAYQNKNGQFGTRQKESIGGN